MDPSSRYQAKKVAGIHRYSEFKTQSRLRPEDVDSSSRDEQNRGDRDSSLESHEGLRGPSRGMASVGLNAIAFVRATYTWSSSGVPPLAGQSRILVWQFELKDGWFCGLMLRRGTGVAAGHARRVHLPALSRGRLLVNRRPRDRTVRQPLPGAPEASPEWDTRSR